MSDDEEGNDSGDGEEEEGGEVPCPSEAMPRTEAKSSLAPRWDGLPSSGPSVPDLPLEAAAKAQEDTSKRRPKRLADEDHDFLGSSGACVGAKIGLTASAQDSDDELECDVIAAEKQRLAARALLAKRTTPGRVATSKPPPKVTPLPCHKNS